MGASLFIRSAIKLKAIDKYSGIHYVHGLLIKNFYALSTRAETEKHEIFLKCFSFSDGAVLKPNQQ